MQSNLNMPNELSSCLSLSKEQFSSQYCKFQRKAAAKLLYFLVLEELKKAVSDGDVKTFENLSNYIECINNLENSNTLKDFVNDTINPVRCTNFIILACKHNKIKILEYIFQNFNIFKTIFGDSVASDLDEACHNSFYYAICSENVELLEMLINGWTEKCFDVYFTELDEILSTAYEELKLKNVPLSGEMELFVENKLISLRFFSSPRVPSGKNNIHRLEERVQLVLENIALLIAEYYSDVKEIDERFLYVGKFIVQNIHILKRLLKSTYDKLPWEEIEFCVVCYISSFINHQEINLVSCAVLNKCRILDHLQNFAHKLKYVFEDTHSLKQRDFAKLNRETVIQQIIKNDPQFEALYNDYQQIRDVHSLEMINKYTNLASSADLQNKEGQLIIARVLQFMGEYFKNTLESPNISKTTSELLLLSLPKNTRALIINLRNSLSHYHSLLSRIEIQKNMSISFFIGVQSDIKKIGSVISGILYRNKFKTIRMILENIVSSERFDEINEALKLINSFKLDDIDSNFLTNSNQLENVILELSKIVTDKTEDEQKLFNKIISIIHLDKTKCESVKKNYILVLNCLKVFRTYINDIQIDKSLRELKSCATEALQHMVLEIEPDSLEEISFLMKNIYKSVSLKNIDNHDEILKLFWEFSNIVEFNSDNVKWIEELKEKLIERNFVVCPQTETFSLSEEKFHKQLKLKLSELKTILSKVLGNHVTIKSISSFKSNKKLQAAVEMLVLDIMSILDSFKKRRLENNLYFMDDTTPLLIGKCLRNHLAHDNAVVNLFLSDPVVTLLLNAKNLAIEDVISSEKKIGKFVIDDPLQLKFRYNRNLLTITNQKNMFLALEKGSLEDFENCIKNGADVNARNLSSWTALHFAAKGTCVSLIKVILELLQTSDCNVKNVDGQNPLHIAAIYGQKSTVEYFVKEAFIPVNDADNFGKTALHIAAENGHKDSVEILLKHNAASFIKDLKGLSPVHYAIRRGHIDIVKILLLKENNVDFNEIRGGFTSLHEAAEWGHFELVNFLIENGANINAKDDSRHWTPLHLAAFEGYLDIVNVLILRGAEVNGQSINGCTALHSAVENGQENIVKVLLEQKANVNVCDKSRYFTPLLVAAKGGYEGILRILLKYKANANAATIAGMTSLHFASEEGYIGIVKALLEHGVDIDARNKILSTSLHCASTNGHSIIVKLLLENKALIAAKDFNHYTSLHLAAFKNHKDVAEILIEKNIEIDAKSKGGHSALHIAAVNCSLNVIDLLIKNKADINSIDNLGFTPLYSAVLKNQKQTVDFLIKNGAKVNTKEMKEKYTPLHIAAYYGYTDIMDILIKNSAEINAKDISDNTPLHIAVEAGFKEAVQILIGKGAYVNAMNTSKITPLLSAVKCNNKDIVEYLISNKADVGVEDHKAISLAVSLGYVGIVKILLKNKIDINKKDAENITLLHIAALKGSTEIVKALIMEGCTVDHKTLYFAAREGYKEIVEILIDNGASVDTKCDDGTTPLHVAAIKGHASVVKLLLNNKANSEIKDDDNRLPVELAVSYGHLEVVKILIPYSSDINAKGNDDWTMLHIACQQTNLEIVKYLVTKGANVSAKNASGSKPIHIAAREGFKAAVEFFLAKGSTINELGADNQTLLHYATMKGHLEIVKYLIAHGADVNAKDNNGLTPMHFAARFGYIFILEYLLANGAIYNICNTSNLKPSDMSKKEDVLKLLLSNEKLFEAVKHNNRAEAENSIKSGAFVNAKNAASGTPLHYAASKGCIEIVDMLLQYKADPNAIGDKGYTPLHYAAKLSHVNVVETLLCNGAIYNVMSESGKTPLDFATDEKITSLLKLVCKSFINVKNKRNSVINDLNKVKDLNTVKAIMNARNRENRTLVVAAIHNNFSKVEQLKEVFQDDVAARISTAIELKNKGESEKSLNIFKSVFEKRKAILGSSNPGTLDIQANIADILYNRGSFHEALNILEEIFQKRKQALGLNDIDTLLTRSTIALTLYRLNRNEEALKIFQEVYQKQKEVLGPNHTITLDTHFHMALMLNGLGKYEEALSINQEFYKREKDANNIRAVRAQNNIALVLANQGKLEEALKIYNEVLEKKKFLLGMTHDDTLRTLDQIAQILLLQKKFPEALKAHEEILNTKKNVLGLNHPLTLTSQYNIANVLLDEGKWIAAFKLLKELSVRRKSIFGPNDPTFLDITAKIEMINMQFKMQGRKEADILHWLQTDMNIAANNGDIQSIEYLLKNGADVNDKDADGRTPLHYAISNGHVSVVTILLKSGADVTQVTNKGNTPLHTAASKGNEVIVQILLEHAIQKKPNFINAQTTIAGNTALHVAAKIGSLDTALSLLKHGAMFDIQNKEGKTACDLSTDQNVISLLKLVNKLFQGAKEGQEEIIKRLKVLKRPELLAIASTRNNQASTLLQVLISNKHKSIAVEFLKMLKNND